MYVLILEFCQNGNLEQHVAQWRRTSYQTCQSYQAPSLANAWLAHVFLGLEHAHVRLQVLLRDVKPANVVISSGNVAKLTDFGFSREGAHHSGVFSFAQYNCPAPGTPCFLAPEIVLGESYGPAADLYSYGVLVWVVLTGGLDGEAPCVSVGSKWSSAKLKSLAKNWMLLKKVIEAPGANRVCPLPGGPKGPAASFILTLTDKGEKRETVNHDDIRKHEFWQCLHSPIPVREAGLDEVETWVENSVANC